MIISAPKLFLHGAFSGPGAVRVEHGRIVEILSGPVRADISLDHGFLTPGLIETAASGKFAVTSDTKRQLASFFMYFFGALATGYAVFFALPITMFIPLAVVIVALLSELLRRS